MSKGFPINIALLSVFTACESYLVAYICQLYTPESVLLSAVATTAITLGLTFYALTTKNDFSDMTSCFKGNSFLDNSGGFHAFIWLVLSVSLINIFFIRSPVINMGIAIIMGMVYCVYLIADTQMIMGDKKRKVRLDNYVMGAAIIYMDIISLFLKILQILGDKKKKD